MRVATWLSDLPDVEQVPGTVLLDLLEDLEQVAARAVEVVEHATGTRMEPGGLRVPKSRLAALGRCERSAVAAAAPSDDDVLQVRGLRGVAYDRFVLHQLHAGRVVDPVADLRSMLIAEGEWSALATLDELEESSPDAAAELLDPVAATVASAWSGIDGSWCARTQSRATLGFAEHRVVCSGVVDVELGGAGSSRPHVLVEVKSGAPGPEHVAEVGLYALLVAAREGRAPAHVARWYPGVAPASVAVTTGQLESAARRLGDGILRWAELVAGRPPSETPGAWCGWCADAAVCPSAESARRINAAGVEE